jgi:3',5'-cyclic AMP phosphodiesterase CpdA
MLRVLRSKGIRAAGALVLLLFPLLARAEYDRFAVLSDSHVGSRKSVYAGFIRLMNEEQIRTLIHTGDVINKPGRTELWKKFFDITGEGKTLHMAAGNHDISDDASYAVWEDFFPPYESFFDGDTLFVVLNTELPGLRSRIAGEQLDWLKAELARPFRYKLGFLHEPLFPVIPLHGLDRHRQARDELHRLFVQAHVNLVIAGHDHVYRRSNRDGITYVVAGSTGGKLPIFGKNDNFFRYMVATRTNGNYVFAVRDMARHVIDVFEVRAPLCDVTVSSGEQREAVCP